MYIEVVMVQIFSIFYFEKITYFIEKFLQFNYIEQNNVKYKPKGFRK